MKPQSNQSAPISGWHLLRVLRDFTISPKLRGRLREPNASNWLPVGTAVPTGQIVEADSLAPDREIGNLLDANILERIARVGPVMASHASPAPRSEPISSRPRWK